MGLGLNTIMGLVGRRNFWAEFSEFGCVRSGLVCSSSTMGREVSERPPVNTFEWQAFYGPFAFTAETGPSGLLG